MNTKAKGSRNERRTIQVLEAAGYRCTKSGASLGAWDVIGIRSFDFVLVQCKTNAWPSPAEIETLEDFPAPVNCFKLVHRWDDRKRKPRVKEIK